MTRPRYECDHCGACCSNLIIEIDLLDLIREPRLIPHTTPFRAPDPSWTLDEDSDEEAAETVPGFEAGGLLVDGTGKPCCLLGADAKCTVYASRPNVCVGMPAGGEQCNIARQAKDLPPLEAIAVRLFPLPMADVLG